MFFWVRANPNDIMQSSATSLDGSTNDQETPRVVQLHGSMTAITTTSATLNAVHVQQGIATIDMFVDSVDLDTSLSKKSAWPICQLQHFC